jgi:hypothetical protein
MTFEVGGERYPLLSVDEMSFAEARELKRISGGMVPADIAVGTATLDPDALLAVFVLSMRRVKPDASEEDLAGENLLAVVNSLDGREDDAGPPDGRATPKRATTRADGGTPRG